MSLLDGLPCDTSPELLLHSAELPPAPSPSTRSNASSSTGGRRRRRPRARQSSIQEVLGIMIESPGVYPYTNTMHDPSQVQTTPIPTPSKHDTLRWTVISTVVIVSAIELLRGLVPAVVPMPPPASTFTVHHALFSELRALQPATVLTADLQCSAAMPTQAEMQRFFTGQTQIDQASLSDLRAGRAELPASSYVMAVACLDPSNENQTMLNILSVGETLTVGGKMVLVFAGAPRDTLIAECCNDGIFHPVMTYPRLTDGTTVLVMERSVSPAHNALMCAGRSRRKAG